MVRKITVVIFLCCMCGYAAYADVIHLKNGNDIEGIILDKQEYSVTIKVDIGTVTFSTDDIESVEESSPEEKEALEKGWEKDKKQRKVENKQIQKELAKEKTSEKKKEISKKEKKSTSKKLATPSKIKWVSYGSGIKVAKNSGKPIMIDFFTDWCGWCKKLDKETFPDKEVRALSTQFVCIKVNADKNKSLVSKYGVRGYPTIIFLNSSGKQIGKIGGYLPGKGFAAKMRQYAK